jgi:hypothetical protein
MQCTAGQQKGKPSQFLKEFEILVQGFPSSDRYFRSAFETGTELLVYGGREVALELDIDRRTLRPT